MNEGIFDFTFPETLVSVCRDGKDLKLISLLENEICVISDLPLEDACVLDLHVNQWEDMKGYVHFKLTDCRIRDKHIEKYYTSYTLEPGKIESEKGIDYQALVSQINDIASGRFKRDPVYSYLIDKKTSHYDIEGLEHPGELEFKSYMYKSLEDRAKDWFHPELPASINGRFRELMQNIDMAVSISGKKAYQRYLENDWESFIEKTIPFSLRQHGIFSKRAERLYIGSEFCHVLILERELLEKIIRKAVKDGITLTVSLSYIPNYCLKKACDLIDCLAECSHLPDEGVELVVNDWGIIEYVNSRKFSNISLSLGRLLNKRKKDPRIRDKIAHDMFENELKQNNLNSKHYTDFLKMSGIGRFEFESHPVGNLIPDGRHSLHFPFYQCNSSQYCPLYAELKNGSRKYQTPVKECPEFCAQHYGIYPDCYPLILKGNTVFAFDNTLLNDPAILEQYASEGIDRLVYNDLGICS